MGAVLADDDALETLLINRKHFSRTVAHDIKFQGKHKEPNSDLRMAFEAKISADDIGVRDGAKGADYCALLSDDRP